MSTSELCKNVKVKIHSLIRTYLHNLVFCWTMQCTHHIRTENILSYLYIFPSRSQWLGTRHWWLDWNIPSKKFPYVVHMTKSEKQASNILIFNLLLYRVWQYVPVARNMRELTMWLYFLFVMNREGDEWDEHQWRLGTYNGHMWQSGKNTEWVNINLLNHTHPLKVITQRAKR